jgi:uncharacterized protein
MADDTSLFRAFPPIINIAGTDDTDLAANLLALVIYENIQGLYRCEATFGNWDVRKQPDAFLYFDRQKLDFGKPFKIKFATDTFFEGRIMGLEAGFPEARPPEITVFAEDRFQDLRMTRRTRTFVDVTDADVMNQIANEQGLSPSVSVSGPTHKVLAQVNQSDLAFLRERARAINAELWMAGKTLNAKPRTERSNGKGAFQMTYGKELHEFTVLADLATQRSTISVNGWDVRAKSALQHEASESVVSGELNGDASGASILATALAARKEAVSHTVPLSSQEAQATAESYYRAMARRFVVGHGVADLSVNLRVGGYISIGNLGPLFSGKYYLAGVRHVFDLEKGARTEFTAERPGLGKAH